MIKFERLEELHENMTHEKMLEVMLENIFRMNKTLIQFMDENKKLLKDNIRLRKILGGVK